MNTSTLRDFLNSIERTERLCRLGMEASANKELLVIIDHLSNILPRCSQVEILALNSILRNILNSMEKKDLLRTADLLYYNLTDYMVSHLNAQSLQIPITNN